jgi:hypothetical protein
MITVADYVDSVTSYDENHKVQAGYAGECGMSDYQLRLYKEEPERGGTGLRRENFAEFR